MSLYRRDRGVTTHNVLITFDNYLNQSRTSFGETIFVFVVPSVLHFVGFISAVYVLRIADNEQLQNLVERVRYTNFCSICNRSWCSDIIQVFILCQLPNRLFLMLWFYITCGLIWLLLMASCIVFVESHSDGVAENLKMIRHFSADVHHYISVSTNCSTLAYQTFLDCSPLHRSSWLYH